MSGRIAWSLCGFTLAVIVGAVALAVPNHYNLWSLAFLVAEASAAMVGGLIASRRPRNPVGWLTIAHALCFSAGEFTRQYAIYGLTSHPGSLPFARVMASPPYWIWYPGIVLLFFFVPLYFPNGRLLSSRWRPMVWIGACVSAIMIVPAAIQPASGETRGIPNPLGIESLKHLGEAGEALGLVIPATWLALGVVAATSLVLRFRRSGGEERQQIKWVVYAVVLLVSFSILNQIGRIFLQQSLPSAASNILFLLPLEGLWVSIAIAILRYRLYDIDRIVNRTLVYGLLTASLAGIYLGLVIALQYAFRRLTGGESQLAVVATTLTIAMLFHPLRRRIQELIDRRFYRSKYDAQKMLETFSTRLRNETDLNELAIALISIVRQTMQPEHASLWLQEPQRKVPRE